MPIYEYTCQDCKQRFEARRKMTEGDNPIACPHCGATGARRAVSRFSAFASDGGQRRAVAGASGCAGCSPSPGGCAGCGGRH